MRRMVAAASGLRSPVPMLAPTVVGDVMAAVDTVLLDCDGVLWKEMTPVDGAAEAIASLRKAGKRVFFVSNNSTKSRSSYVEKLTGLGIPATEEDVMSSSFATALYLKERLPADSKVYVIGHEGLHTELQLQGLETLGFEDGTKRFSMADFTPDVIDPSVKAVVAGMDLRLNFFKIARAKAFLDSVPGCLFIATNTDSTFPGPHMFHPGGGVCVNAVEHCTRPVDAVVGKPNTIFLDLLSSLYGVDPKRCLMVGDRLNTDIVFGNTGGCTTVLVGTGVHSSEDAASRAEGDMERPDYFLTSIALFSTLLGDV